VSELKDGEIRTFHVDPGDAGLPYARLSDLAAETPEESANMIRRMLDGETGPVRDISVLNAAAALVVAGKAPDLREGAALAEQAIDSEKGRQTLETLIRKSHE
jgi:anthranilate phosphoribosyltransferase